VPDFSSREHVCPRSYRGGLTWTFPLRIHRTLGIAPGAACSVRVHEPTVRSFAKSGEQNSPATPSAFTTSGSHVAAMPTPTNAGAGTVAASAGAGAPPAATACMAATSGTSSIHYEARATPQPVKSYLHIG